ncbi:GNAT family N-acetyltransferase [Reinekea marinisedimentorum]|uniref:Acetyltransferase (GNAT) family protein n=1 Tax=Reinekea marinisedimentorum TaxID=230495 RepID=A0A4R3HQP4_9GAMM|nr:GNAT family N-acetyltransferase [Reinekea marinisedimentorum]TCS34663.1 acetyltransferase (GNAT) family protein [Reinekea marinisedimentorum]
MDLELVKATEEGKREIWDLFVPEMKPHVDRIWGWEDGWQINEFNRRYFKLNTSFIVFSNQKLGYVQYSLNEGDTYLNMVILGPAQQGKGLGKKVLRLIQNLQPDKPLKLRCFHVNVRALRFYEVNGFHIIESDDNFVLLQRDT